MLTSEEGCEFPGVGYRRGDVIAPFLPLVVADSNEQSLLRARTAGGRYVGYDGHRGGGRVEIVENGNPVLMLYMSPHVLVARMGGEHRDQVSW